MEENNSLFTAYRYKAVTGKGLYQKYLRVDGLWSMNPNDVLMQFLTLEDAVEYLERNFPVMVCFVRKGNKSVRVNGEAKQKSILRNILKDWRD